MDACSHRMRLLGQDRVVGPAVSAYASSVSANVL
jgi:hypothetical protein